jgi:hypothetical protein
MRGKMTKDQHFLLVLSIPRLGVQIINPDPDPGPDPDPDSLNPDNPDRQTHK